MAGVLRGAAVWVSLALVVAVLPGTAGAATPIWRSQPMAGPGAGGEFFIDGVSCSATNACTAVGASHYPGTAISDAPLAERWDGTGWTIQATPVPAGVTDAALTQVSCPTATTCVAAGNLQNSQGSGVFVEIWDGTDWSLMALPSALASSSAGVGGINCVTATWCKLAGSVVGTDGNGKPFVETWNGTAWSADVVPLPAAATYGNFTAIDCFSPSACAAVGNFGSPSLGAAGRAPALAETWNGTTWHVDGAADPGGQTLPAGVSCPAAGTCFAVGWYRSGAGHSAPLVEKKAGSLWLQQTAPLPKTGTDHGLFSVSCASTSSCETVGFDFGSGIPPSGYAAAYSGLTGWKAEPLPAGDFLQAVSCPARTYCVAVGATLSNGAPESAIRS